MCAAFKENTCILQNLTSHLFFSIAGCSKSCEAVQYWSSGFTVLQASIDTAIIQVTMKKEENRVKLCFTNHPRSLYHGISFDCCQMYKIHNLIQLLYGKR